MASRLNMALARDGALGLSQSTGSALIPNEEALIRAIVANAGMLKSN